MSVGVWNSERVPQSITLLIQDVDRHRIFSGSNCLAKNSTSLAMILELMIDGAVASPITVVFCDG